MRILILGGTGMLGHQLLTSLADKHEVKVTLRGPIHEYEHYGLFNRNNAFDNIDVSDLPALTGVLENFRPEAVINAVGLIKQLDAANYTKSNIELNALFPWQLSELCAMVGARVVQMSTDCVFSGEKGSYTESDIADAMDVYGRTKYLGELDSAHAITLRTSIIGLELNRKKSLIEWFLQAHGSIRGFRRAIYSGFTTLEMANILDYILVDHPDINGVWHVASAPVSKYDLLAGLSERLGRKDIEILPDDEFACDRSLDASRFNTATGYVPPEWDKMLDDLAGQIDSRKT